MEKVEKSKLTMIKEKLKPILNILFKAVIITSLVIASFYQGTLVEKSRNVKEIEVEVNVTKVNKNQVNIAIDESNNLIIIDKETGKYTIYQDSIGQSIFKIYARNIWNKDNVK